MTDDRLPDPAVVVLAGAAGSGKSTWAGRRFRTAEVVSSDALRAAVGSGPSDLDASVEAFALLDQIVSARTKRSLMTVIDTLGLDPERRADYLRLARVTRLPAVLVIMNTVAELWSVQQNGEGRSLSLTLWKPKDGSGDMVTLSVTSGNVAHQVNTVRGATTSGSGKVTLEKAGNGGTFTVDAKSSTGTSISGAIKCDAFAPHMAEGG